MAENSQTNSMITIVPYNEAWPSAFCDYLRSHTEVAAEYLALKHKLAAENHGNTLESQERYSLSKSDFVAALLKIALSKSSSLP